MPTKRMNLREGQCPFLKSMTKQEIFCESPLMGYREEECFSKLFFWNNEQRNRHYREYCCRMWKMCEMAVAILKKYDEDTTNDL